LRSLLRSAVTEDYVTQTKFDILVVRPEARNSIFGPFSPCEK